MRKAHAIMIAGAIALSQVLAGSATAGSKSRQTLRLKTYQSSYGYAIQTTRVKFHCFPARLNRILVHIARQTGRRPLVTSGHRSGGRRHSMHRSCGAADIRVPGVSVSRIVAAARSAPNIGGIGTYCNGIVHVDVGPKRRWHYC